MDHTFNSNHRIYGRYWLSKAAVPENLDTSNVLTSAFGRTWDNPISRSTNSGGLAWLVNNLVVTYNRTDNDNFQAVRVECRHRHPRGVQRRQPAVVLQRRRLVRHQYG